VVLADWGGKACAAVADTVKAFIAATAAGLCGLGLRAALVTGDSQAVAEAVAAEIGADDVIADDGPALAATDLGLDRVPPTCGTTTPR
jgi:P-type Cu+ transporter